MTDRVRAVQERRRSNAAGPHRQHRDKGPTVAEFQGDFFEEDEPVEKINAVWQRSVHGRTRRPSA